MVKKVLKNPSYVIVKINYEYNDEVYSRGENADAGDPVHVYLNREKADKVAAQMNFNELLEIDLGHYGYGSDEIFRDENKFEDLIKTIDPEFCMESYIDNQMEGHGVTASMKKLSPEAQIELANTLKVRFFKVIEVELED